MPHLTIIDKFGRHHGVDATPGMTLMQAIVNNDIEGIVAECGGSCACGTCHCYLDPSARGSLSPQSPQELATLECSLDVNDNSRLACQITITEAMQNLIVRLPAQQI